MLLGTLMSCARGFEGGSLDKQSHVAYGSRFGLNMMRKVGEAEVRAPAGSASEQPIYDITPLLLWCGAGASRQESRTAPWCE
jgi:hypothetical protein